MNAGWRFGFVALCVLIGYGAAQTQEEILIADQPTTPKMAIEVSKTQVKLIGDVSSVAHESILRQRAQTLFPGKTLSFDMRELPALPGGWALLSELALRAAANTYSSTTEISPEKIRIRGVTADIGAWKESLSGLERHLLPGMQVDHEVRELIAAGSLDRQCISLFRTAQVGRKIEFPRSEATLSTRSWPLLDELVQIASDCPGATIDITGHTDNTGEESGNLALSQGRAGAIAAYMIGKGIATERIVVKGAGSALPLVDEDTPQAHQLNRRIEIELVF